LGCETSRLPHFLEIPFTDGGEVVSLYPQEDSWYSFLLEAESIPRVIVRLEGLDQLKTPISSSGVESATFRLAACIYKRILNFKECNWKKKEIRNRCRGNKSTVSVPIVRSHACPYPVTSQGSRNNSGGAKLEYRSGHRLSCLRSFVTFVSTSRKCWDSTFIWGRTVSFLILSNSYIIHYDQF
jgi:hypothetical protein